MRIFSFIKSAKYRNNKAAYYVIGYIRYWSPKFYFRKRLHKELSKINKVTEKEYILDRVNYYNKLSQTVPLNTEVTTPLSKFKLGKKGKSPFGFKVYFFDAIKYTRYFSNKLRAAFLFGDVTHVPDYPTIIKSRPIHGNNENSVVLNMESIRHFQFINDPIRFEDKSNRLIGRGAVTQPHRIRFYEKYFGHPMCDLGQINHNNTDHPEWNVPKMALVDHLEYKFILCLEGYDVASNLKWVMSSNSLAVMPRPTYETWYMEGKLIPDYHYVAIKDDYSDLEERMNYYIQHPDKANEIIRHAHEYIEQFKNKKREKLISLLVLKKYFEKTGQL